MNLETIHQMISQLVTTVRCANWYFLSAIKFSRKHPNNVKPPTCKHALVTIGFCSSISPTPNIVAAFPAGDPGVLRRLTCACDWPPAGRCRAAGGWESPLGNIFLSPKLMLYVGFKRFLSNKRITPYSIRAPNTCWKDKSVFRTMPNKSKTSARKWHL